MRQTFQTLDIARPTVAVIIPYFNGARWIERAVKSVVNQTMPPDEFIIVNDGSKPDERAALEVLAKTHPFTIIDQENGGQGSARNTGVWATKSEFISFLDQDDFYLPTHIEDLINALPKNDSRFGFVYADLNIADAYGELVFTETVKEHSPLNPKRSLIDLLRADMFVLPSASIISRSAFAAVEGFDPQLTGYEDDDLFLRIFRKGFTNYYLDKPVTVWRIHGDSTSYSIRMSRSRFRYFLKLTEKFPDNPERNLFFFRDCISPRFGRSFLAEAVKAVANKSSDKPELLQFLRQYARILQESKYTARKRKWKFALFVFLLTYAPPWAIKGMRHATFIPFVRRSLA